MAGSNKATFARLLGKFCRLPTYCKSLLREAVCVATAAAARACGLSALLRSSPGSAYSCTSTEPVLVHGKQFSVCVCSTGSKPASRSSQFVYMVLCGREVAREAKTGRVLFASVSVVMKGHVFTENGSRGAVHLVDKDGRHLADSQTVKIVRFGVWLFIRKVSGVCRSAFSYVFTWQLQV